jgi:hypothetical protein
VTHALLLAHHPPPHTHTPRHPHTSDLQTCAEMCAILVAHHHPTPPRTHPHMDPPAITSDVRNLLLQCMCCCWLIAHTCAHPPTHTHHLTCKPLLRCVRYCWHITPPTHTPTPARHPSAHEPPSLNSCYWWHITPPPPAAPCRTHPHMDAPLLPLISRTSAATHALLLAHHHTQLHSTGNRQ